jgi:(3,5-dihydroxyphenyl)acetyl-CoA 1,2-dioxygenase
MVTLERAGLPASETAAWTAASPDDEVAAGAVSGYLVRGRELIARLPAPAGRNDDERAAARAIGDALDATRDRFLRAHAVELYDELTAGRARPIRLEELVYAAAERVPGLVPTRAEMDIERALPLAHKERVELSQGLLVSHVLASPGAGRHLVESMLEPCAAALERLDGFVDSGVADLGPAAVRRHGRAGVLELRNPRHLNAEDGLTLGPTEWAVDLMLLDPSIEVGVFRGAIVDHPRYAGQRVFGSGINLTHLYHGRIDFLFYLVRDLGYVNKIYRGLAPDGPEKLWVAAVERFAIGGACQLLHVVDHVIAARGSRLYLPARREGIIPGASNLRLPRFVGDRAARQAILSGREWTAGEPDAASLCDEVVEPDEVDRAIDARIEALTSSGLINAAANRRALRVGEEPIDLFREYMATYAREQAYCHLSPALVSNLEQHWNAHNRAV